MFTSVSIVAFLLPNIAAQKESPSRPPEGLFAVQCLVVRVLKDSLEVEIEDGPKGFRIPGRRKLKITKESRLEQMQTGKSELTRSIVLADLQPEQEISVIVHSDGSDITLLLGVASLPRVEVLELAQHVRKLGGKLKRRTDYKDRVIYDVDLRDTRTTDADLKLLGQAKRLASLDVSFTPITDQGIAQLAHAIDLDTLNLNGTKITDGAVLHLRQLHNLHRLDLAQTAVTDAGFDELVRRKSITIARVGLGAKAHFRVHQDYSDGKLNLNYLMIGNTYFGSYLAGTEPRLLEDVRDRRRQATTYYHRHGPVGQVMAKLEWFRPAGLLDYPSDVRLPASVVAMLAGSPPHALCPASTAWAEPAIGVVRLNVGTHAVYGRPLQHMHFYNSTPEIKSFSLAAKDRAPYFGYVQDALKRGCAVRIIDGPERATLSKSRPKAFYSALFVEAARNDLMDVDTSLFTKEAVAELMESLTETGVLCYHTSHRTYELYLPLVDAAKEHGLAWKLMKDHGGRSGRKRGDSTHYGSEWLMIARSPNDLTHLHEVNDDGPQLVCKTPASTGKYLWRDGQPHDLNALTRPLPK